MRALKHPRNMRKVRKNTAFLGGPVAFGKRGPFQGVFPNYIP